MAETIPKWSAEDEANGCPYAAEQLALARTDLLVQTMRLRRCETM
jgi:hypothetical protein